MRREKEFRCLYSVLCIDLLMLREETLPEETEKKTNRKFNFGVSFLVLLWNII